ncbi:MAG: ScpA family protein [Phycisphaerales bacterium]
MALQEDYRVSLDHFEGPLDLLLYLIRRSEVDIHEISVARICDQYLAFLKGVDTVDVEVAGDFLVMAATLVEIKSRTLVPPEEGEGGSDAAQPEDDGEPADPRDELIRVLLMYQRFRDAGEQLDASRAALFQSLPRAVGQAVRKAMRADRAEERTLELEDAHPMDLAEAYEQVMSAVNLDRVGDHVVEMDDTPIIIHQADLIDRLEHAVDGRLTLQDAFDGHTTLQRIGLFMATLELTRQRRIDVTQDEIDDPVEILLRPEEASEPGDETGEGADNGFDEGQAGNNEAKNAAAPAHAPPAAGDGVSTPEFTAP